MEQEICVKKLLRYVEGKMTFHHESRKECDSKGDFQLGCHYQLVEMVYSDLYGEITLGYLDKDTPTQTGGGDE